ncbi:uncharacterized protein VTP21DRAFT_8983 [Calcarisporiella thermophila]|uniref:uncharacterized protein n=1 Tax=Calcarisporiella thermophila TaxID=911321 RepID=UPI0037442484
MQITILLFAIFLNLLNAIEAGQSSVGGQLLVPTPSAGIQCGEIYESTEKLNFTILGGSFLTVGATGEFVQGGGHSALSPRYGLSVDNVVQFTALTADGKLRMANSRQNKELFWALREGGGETYGVVVTDTYKTHSALRDLFGLPFRVNGTGSAAVKEPLKVFIRINSSQTDAGWGGYFDLVNSAMLLAYIFPSEIKSLAADTVGPLMVFAKK